MNFIAFLSDRLIGFFIFCPGNNFSFCQRTAVTGEILCSVRRGFEDLSGCFVPGCICLNNIVSRMFFMNFIAFLSEKLCFLNEVSAKALE